MNYSPGAVANFFLEKAWNKSCGLTPMHLQKLMYFANGWYMAFYNEGDEIFPLINESFKSWEYGPVCESVYYEFKKFGGNFISKGCLMTEIEVSDDLLEVNIRTNKVSKDDNEVNELLEDVWLKYAHLELSILSTIILEETADNPWRKSRKEGLETGIIRGKEIDSYDTKYYFNNKLHPS